MSRGWLDFLFGAYLLVCVAALVGPGMMSVGARDTPLVLGLPFALAWSVLWVVATFLALCAYHALRERTRP